MKELSLKEEAKLFQGKDRWHTNAIKNTKYHSITMHDGPNGLRIELSNKLGFGLSKPALSYPSEALVGCSFDRSLLKEYGSILAEDCAQEKTDVLLGPGTTHKRSPLGGRNFEYFSEDPVLSGELSASYISGLQDNGIGASLKHFATNNRELGRMVCDSVIDERTLHEIYLKPFKIAIEKSKPWTLMNAYNKLNGIHCTENKQLMDEARSWGFDGAFISDWGAVYDPVESIKTGLNLEMPGGSIGADKLILEAVNKKQLDESVLHQSTQYLKKLIDKCGKYEVRKYDRKKHLEFAKRSAEESIVLLKNEDHILPLNKEDKVLVIGPSARYPKATGSGSSSVNVDMVDTIYTSMKKYSSNVIYRQGFGDEQNNDNLFKEALKQVEKVNKVIVVCSLNDGDESEGFDRYHMNLPTNQLNLINEILTITNDLIVVLETGSPVKLPFVNDVKGIIANYFSGSCGGDALASILYGKVNPSGKLAETWPLNEELIPCSRWFLNDRYETQFRETIYTGYRYYDTFHKETLFDFGYGSSYTTFEYRFISNELKEDGLYTTITLKNIGDMDGKEIIEVYMSFENSKIARCNHELINFEKVFLKVNEEKTIVIHTSLDTLKYYDVKKKDYRLEEGDYCISVGGSLNDLALHETIYLKGESHPYSTIDKDMYTNDFDLSDENYEKILEHPLPPKRKPYPFTADSTIGELQEKKLGKIIYDIASKIAKSGFVAGMDERVIDDTCIRQMIWLDGINWKTVELGVSYMNQHHFSILKKLLKSIQKEESQ